jgi:hypothetical protein
MTRAEMLDPANCAECHPQHHLEWSGSMHAYAARDPVFLAMNARGQRETNGELGDFCVRCHAPMAVREGYTTDGLNLSEVPDHLQGVTCYFCHNAVSVEGEHNAPITLANDRTLRAGIADPIANSGHRSGYSPLHDRRELDSADLCGSCHDIVTPAGVHLERTFAEWKNSLYADPVSGRQQTCGNCHMQGYDGVAADYDGVLVRRVHRHDMAGVDVALDDFPETEAQWAAVQRALDTVVLNELEVCFVGQGAEILVSLENVAAGHSWPSGAAHDRRAWVEVQAWREGDLIYSSGVVNEGSAVLELDDPDLWAIGDTLTDEDGRFVHMFWDAKAVESQLLPAPTAASPLDPRYIDTHVRRSYYIPDQRPDRVRVGLRIRPMGLDVMDDLIASGDLDPIYRERIPTFDLRNSYREWTVDDGTCILR